MEAKLLTTPKLLEIFNQQVAMLIKYRYDDLAGDNQENLLRCLEALSRRIRKENKEVRIRPGCIPCVTVISMDMIDIPRQTSRLFVKGKRGICMLPRVDHINTRVPTPPVYLIFDVDPGWNKLRNVAIDEARVVMRVRFQTPLTIEEGLALARYYPAVLRRQRYLFLLGNGDEQRLCIRRDYPALITSDNGPTLTYADPTNIKHFHFAFPARDANALICAMPRSAARNRR